MAARSARRAAAAAARLARALAALHTQPLHSAATVMMTEATSDESVADTNTCMGPVPLRREETMVCGQAGAVPSYKDEETRTDSCRRRDRAPQLDAPSRGGLPGGISVVWAQNQPQMMATDALSATHTTKTPERQRCRSVFVKFDTSSDL